MKKLLILWAILIAVSILFLLSFAIIKTAQGEHVTSYWRFYKSDSRGEKTFNWTGLLFQPQVESQKADSTSMHFTHRIMYPIAPKFQVVEPFDRSADTAIAKEIAQVVKDSIASIQYKLWGNLDGQAVAVRNYIKPKTLTAHRDSLSLSLFGTASPEAEKYGFIQSIQPEHKEKENKVLAANRLSRTRNILIRKLEADGIRTTKKISIASAELQLTRKTQLDSVEQGHREILDSMRYVDADVNITTERITVTPVTAPILLFVLLTLLTLLSRIRFKKLEEPAQRAVQRTAITALEPIEDPNKTNWVQMLFFILLCAAIITAAVIWWNIVQWILLGFAVLAGLVIIIILIVSNWNSLGRFFRWIWSGLVALWLAIRDFFRRWWPRRWECRLVVILLLLSWLAIILMIIYWPHCHC